MTEHDGKTSDRIGHHLTCPEGRYYNKWKSDPTYSREKSIADNKDLERLRALSRDLTEEEKDKLYGPYNLSVRRIGTISSPPRRVVPRHIVPHPCLNWIPNQLLLIPTAFSGRYPPQQSSTK